MNAELQQILFWAVGIVGGGAGIRAGITWAVRQGLITAGDTSQKGLIEDLRTEAKKWQDRYDAEVANHSEARRQHETTLVLLGEVRAQNKMLRLILIQRGMTSEEINAALDMEIDDGH